MRIQDVVNDHEWQEMRKGFVGTWKKTPERNCDRLRQYLYEVPGDALRHRRILNYLTGSGFRMGVINHPAIDSLLMEVRRSWMNLLRGGAL